jgi:hypothetical protein
MTSQLDQTRVERFGFRNFKAFGDEDHPVRLRPLTLVFGRNNAGKSAIVRLPTLLAGSLMPGAARGLSLNHDEVSFGRRLEHFVHGQVANRCTVSLVLRLAGARVELDAEIGPGAQGGDQAVHRLRLSDGAARTFVHLPPRSAWDLCGTSGTFASASQSGLLPDLIDVINEVRADDPSAVSWLLNTLVGLTSAAFTLVDRVGPIRVEPNFSWDIPVQSPTRVLASGADAPSMLAWDRLHGDGRLVTDTSAWLHRITGNRLVVSDFGGGASRADSFSLLVDRDGRSPINAALAGTGVQQVLPVVVQLAAAMSGRSPAGVLVIEEPETHLHPAAHAELAELLLAVSGSGRAPPLLVETHSETLLLRLRRRIAEGVFADGDPNKQIAIYFVDDFQQPPVLRELRLDEEGFIDDWPQRVFDEDAAERRGIHLALANRGPA